MGNPSTEISIHATTVAVNSRAVVILGPSGSGKSGLALQMMALGATLITDDRTILTREDDQIWAKAPTPIAGQIEARGVGILAAPTSGPARVSLVVDLGAEESERLPPHRNTQVLGLPLPLVKKLNSQHFPAALMLYLAQGRVA